MQNIFTALTGVSAVALDIFHEPSNLHTHDAFQDLGINLDNFADLSKSMDMDPCSIACTVLSTHYGTSYVLTSNETAYTAFREGYWSAIQSDVYPQCIFEPPDTDAVSALILLSQTLQCPFAFKSGGHAAYTGASNIQGGITVSLNNLNSIELSADKSIAFVEPGNTWVQVYTKLAEDEVTVIGGRVARIGVGGLTLGGGISFFSGFHGWACDNVEAYEIVTACGQLVTANVSHYSDLYWALRGGGNNFGIVTKFHLRTVPIPGNTIWGGTRTYLEPEFPSVVQAFTNLALNAESDPRAGQWTAFVQFNSTNLAASTLWYSNPANITETKIFDEFNTINAIADSTGVQDLVQFVTKIQESNPYGKREVYWALTTKVSVELANFAIETFYAALASVINLNGSMPVLLFQSITVPQMVNMAQDGGNPLGLDPADGPFYLWSLPTMWNDATDDSVIYSFVSGVLQEISDKAKELDLQNDYIYMNYASEYQDVIRGYGAANKARLIEIAQKYDPKGVFQTLQPGYFKLTHPPLESNYFSGSWD